MKSQLKGTRKIKKWKSVGFVAVVAGFLFSILAHAGDAPVTPSLAWVEGRGDTPVLEAINAACKKAPPSYWIWDGIHPTYSGHQIMADEWERVVRGFWPND